LFIQVSQEVWLEPIPTYGSLFIAKAGSAHANPERWVAVLVGTMDVVLTYFLAVRLLHSSSLGCVAAILLLCSPAHVIYSRIAPTDGVWVLPFVLVWLLALTTLLGKASRPALTIGGAALAASVYSEPSAALLMLILLLIAVVGAFRANRLSWNEARLVAGVVAIGLMPLVAWYVIYPSSYPDTLGRWVLHPAHIRNPVALAQAVTNWYSLTTWVGTYWDFFNPAHLLFAPSAPAWAGVFLLPVGVSIGVGCHEMTRQRHN
jgi:4-amino-4-deoxy-L-arabinose transferase-like glycosyltransferase